MTPPEELNVILLLPRPALDSPQLIVWVEVLAPLQRFPARSQPRTDRSPGWPPTIWHEVPRFPRVDGWLDAEQPPEWREFLIEYFTLNSCLLPPPDLTDWQTSLHNNSQHQVKASALTEWSWGLRHKRHSVCHITAVSSGVLGHSEAGRQTVILQSSEPQ